MLSPVLPMSVYCKYSRECLEGDDLQSNWCERRLDIVAALDVLLAPLVIQHIDLAGVALRSPGELSVSLRRLARSGLVPLTSHI